MVYLQDSDNASRLYALSGSGIRRLSTTRSRLLKKTVARKVSGHLGHFANKPAAVYVAGGRLWLAIEGQPWFFDELSAEVDQTDDGYSVDISTPGRRYQFFVDANEFDADTAFAALEDSSFGLWAARIINNHERQNVLLEVLADAPLNEVPEHAEMDAHGDPINLRHSWARSSQSTDGHSNQSRSTE